MTPRSRVVFRIRCSLTRAWKATTYSDSRKPMDFFTRAEARNYARFLKYWHLVKVTIHPRST